MQRRCRPWLGTYVEVASDSEDAIAAAFAAIAQVHALMSVHDPASELSAINRLAHREVVPLHPWTAAVLRRALFWAALSEGAFDPAIGAVAQARRLLPRHAGHPLPDPTADWRAVRLEADRVRLERPLLIDLGGIAKGFAIDRALAAMRAPGVKAECGMVNAGGDMAAFGRKRWVTHVLDPVTRRPVAELALFEGAIATSAVHAAGRRANGRHLPKRSARIAAATVKAPAALDADALTKVVLAGSARMLDCLAAVGAVALRLGLDGTVEAFEAAQR